MGETSRSRGEEVTVFSAGGVEYGVVGTVRRSVPAPEPPPSRILHGGAAYPVVDLGAMAGARTGGSGLLFLVEEARGEEVVRRALAGVDPVGVEAFDPGGVQAVPDLYPEGERHRWRGLLPRADGRIVVLLDLAGLGRETAGGGGEG